MRLIKNDPRAECLRALYRKHNKTSLVINRACNIGWLLGGRSQIGIAGDGGVCTVVVNDESVIVVTNNIEGERLTAEEFGSVPEITVVPWYDGPAYRQAVDTAAGAAPLRDTECESEMLPIRTVLLPQQQEEAREIASLASAAITAAVKRVQPQMTEFQISGILADEAMSRGLIPNVLFTPADRRIKMWRHALSTDNKLEKIVMLSMGSQRNGMYCSITRFVSFGKPDEETLRSQDVACRAAAYLYSATRPGKSYHELYKDLYEAYIRAGAPEQIERHHQGGLGGFQTREVRIDASSTGTVMAGQLYAWNPSAPGFKSEDMLLVGEDKNELLTDTPEFEYKEYVCDGKVWRLPQILVI